MKKLVAKLRGRREFTDLQNFVNAFREVMGLDPLYPAAEVPMVERFYRPPPSLPHAQPRSRTTGFSTLGSHRDVDVEEVETTDDEAEARVNRPLCFESHLRRRVNKRWARVRADRMARLPDDGA